MTGDGGFNKVDLHFLDGDGLVSCLFGLHLFGFDDGVLMVGLLIVGSLILGLLILGFLVLGFLTLGLLIVGFWFLGFCVLDFWFLGF